MAGKRSLNPSLQYRGFAIDVFRACASVDGAAGHGCLESAHGEMAWQARMSSEAGMERGDKKCQRDSHCIWRDCCRGQPSAVGIRLLAQNELSHRGCRKPG